MWHLRYWCMMHLHADMEGFQPVVVFLDVVQCHGLSAHSLQHILTCPQRLSRRTGSLPKQVHAHMPKPGQPCLCTTILPVQTACMGTQCCMSGLEHLAQSHANPAAASMFSSPTATSDTRSLASACKRWSHATGAHCRQRWQPTSGPSSGPHPVFKLWQLDTPVP